MADVAKQIEEHLKRRYGGPGEPNFAQYLSVSDKFEAHGLGVLLEELMSTAELMEYDRSKIAASSGDAQEVPIVAVAYSCASQRRVN
jgi:hypothetical protein